MYDRSVFSPEEWQLLSRAPMMAVSAVIFADKGGMMSMLKEMMAVLSRLQQLAKEAPNEFIRAVVEDLNKPDAIELPKKVREENMPALLRKNALADCREASRLVSSRLSLEDGIAYRALVMECAQKAAEASKEGGFLGFGGVLVSPEEEKMLAEIRSALS
ncbi:MAG: hypothetical protein K2X35_24630 [Bryobacteraceae bacterium]|nr:hypothetical protein [Bryobacteraceae bacterium]